MRFETNGDDHATQLAEREATLRRLVDSRHPKRLIVAGPGTGKTVAFKQAFDKVGNKGLAMTFIRALVKDLRATLPTSVDVKTFHRYAVHLLYHLHGGALAMYPALTVLEAEDLAQLGFDIHEPLTIDRTFHDLDEQSPLLHEAIALSDYYGAVPWTEAVYRVVFHLRTNPGEIPAHELVCVDEYQDFSRLENELLSLLGNVNRVLVAGDDDQALYEFKGASPSFIRALAADAGWERHELPYCMRCTQVIVDAVNDVIAAAKTVGCLEKRLDKPFKCFRPAKGPDSDAHPRIVHAHCSIQKKAANTNYMGQYVVQQLQAISMEDIEASRKGGYPTALVVGRNPYLRQVSDFVKSVYPHVVTGGTPQPEVRPLDGYARLAEDPASRLGWRIMVHCFDSPEAVANLARILVEKGEIASVVPPAYKTKHLQIAEVVGRLMRGKTLTNVEEEQLEIDLGQSLEEVRAALRLGEDQDSDSSGDIAEADVMSETGVPSIVCTTIVGSKGLSADHVFLVGCNDGSLPQDPTNIRDSEVCSFLVALSRTRKACHLVSCGRFGAGLTRPSTFLSWIAERVERREINARYWRAGA